MANSKLDILPRFTIRNILPGKVDDEDVIVSGEFSSLDTISVGDRGWLFATDTDWPLADVTSLDGAAARLDVVPWSITSPLEIASSLPWLNSYWNARDIAFLIDSTREWRRVAYRSTDAIVFGQKLPGHDKEAVGWQEATVPLAADRRFIEIRHSGWDHDHCLICNVAIGRSVTHGFREASFVDGPNSVGIWLCDGCFDRYVKTGDFSFLV